MADVKRFCIQGTGFLSGFLTNMQPVKQGISLCNSQPGGYISKILDSTNTTTQWGRLVLNGEFDGDCEFTIYTLVLSDDTIIHNNKNQKLDKIFRSKQVTFAEKVAILETQGAQVSANLCDILLTNQEGRYFVFAIQLCSANPAIIKSVSIISPAETLMSYLPEVFSSREPDFLKRYLAIFGSIFNDRREAIAKLPDYLDINKAPADMLPILANWLGLTSYSVFLNSAQLRKILKMAKEISQFKGTKRILEEVLGVFLGKRPIIVEQFKWQKYAENEHQGSCENLYGSNSNEFTILIEESVDETAFLQLKNLIEMLSPIQAKANVIFLDKCCAFDKYTYLETNSILQDAQVCPTFDNCRALDDGTSLI